jgi:hypothetical protein
MATISLDRQLRQLKQEFRNVEEKIVRAATASAINKVTTQARTQASRNIARTYGLPASAVKKSLYVSPRANFRSITAAIKAEGVNLPLIVFSARQTRAGVTVRVKGGRQLVRSAFIATMKSGHRGVFGRGRYGQQGFTPGKARLPITELVGVGVPTAFKNAQVLAAMRALIDEKFPTIMRAEIAFRLSRV